MTRKCNNEVNRLNINLNRLKNNNLKMKEIESILNTLEEKNIINNWKDLYNISVKDDLSIEDLFSIYSNVKNYILEDKEINDLSYTILPLVFTTFFSLVVGGVSGYIGSKAENFGNAIDMVGNYSAYIGGLLLAAIAVYTIIIVYKKKGSEYNNFAYKFYLLLDFVIEIKKEEEMMENKNQPTAEVEEEAENEILKDLTTDLLDTKSTNGLLKGLDNKMEYDTIKKDISNYELPELYPLKANLKNALANGKYAYSIIFQYIAVVASFVTGLIVKDKPFSLIVIALLIISGLFLLITKEIVTDKNDVKKRFLLEIVEEEIESKKNSNK